MSRLYKIFLSLIILFIIVSIFFHKSTALSDDLGWQITDGRITLQNHFPQNINLYSYTNPDFHNNYNHWLSEVAFYIIYQFSGINGEIIFATVSMLIAFGLLLFYVLKRNNILIVGTTTLAYVFLLVQRPYIRAEIFSYLFLSIYIFLLYKYREKFTKWILVLIPLSLLWVNMHVYFIVGLLVIGCFLLDSIFVHRKNLKHKQVTYLGIVLISSILISLINPTGIYGLLYPIIFNQNYGFTVSENINIFQKQSSQNGVIYSLLLFELIIVSQFLFLILSGKKVKVVNWLLSILFSIIGVMAVRNVCLFIFGTLIAFTESATVIVQMYFPKIQKNKQQLFTSYYLFICCIGIYIIFLFLSTFPFGLGGIDQNKNAVDFFINNKLQGNILNNYDIGGYLIFRLYPGEKVFADPRPEAYPAGYAMNVYYPALSDSNKLEELVNKYQINTILFRYPDASEFNTHFFKNILVNDKLKLIYLDEATIILIKNNGENKSLIKKYGMERTTLRYTINNTDQVGSLLSYAKFFFSVGWSEQEIGALQRVLQYDPNNCIALGRLVNLLQNQSDQQGMVSALNFKFTTQCHL